MLNFISAFLLLYSLHFQDPSGFWIKSAESSSDAFFYKSKYLSKVGSNITIWIKRVPISPEESDGKMVSYELQLYECNCSNYSSNLLSLYKYEENGNAIGTFSFKEKDFTYAPPGSVKYGFLNDICTRFNKKKK